MSESSKASVVAVKAAIADASPTVLANLKEDFNLTVVSDPLLNSDDFHLDAAVSGLIVTDKTPITASLLEQANHLKVVSVRAVGFDQVDLRACEASGVIVCHTPNVLDGSVADLTIALLLSAARHLPNEFRRMEGDWYRKPDETVLGRDVRGKTLGILGMGRIGSVVARTANRGFDMDVLYFNRRPRVDMPEERSYARYVTRDVLLARSDFLSLHMPLTPDSHHSISTREFEAMRRSAILINTSRGDVVDEEALVAALRAGEIAGAGLDVMAEEPYPPSGPLRSLPNVVLTPHIGSATLETRRAMSDLAIRNLTAVIGGDPHSASIVRYEARRRT